MATGARGQDPIENILRVCCTATGAGKAAAFAIPGLVLNEYNAHPDAYPAGFPTQKRPIGVVITPTKGLANNTVHFLPHFYLFYSQLSRFWNYQNLMSLRGFIVLPRNPERSTKGWDPFGRCD